MIDLGRKKTILFSESRPLLHLAFPFTIFLSFPFKVHCLLPPLLLVFIYLICVLDTQKGGQWVSYCPTEMSPLYQLVQNLVGLGKADRHTFALLVSSSVRASRKREMVLRYFSREN